MSSISTGPSTSRVLRAAILVFFTGGFAVAFLYDGYVGYAKENLRQFLKAVGDLDVHREIHWELTAERGKEFAAAWPPGTEFREIESVLGRPAYEANATAYYFGPGGRLEIRREGRFTARVSWADAVHTETDQFWQRRIGYVLIIATLGFGIRLVRVLRSRVVWNEEGLFVSGEGWFPTSQIVEVGRNRIDSDGQVEVNCACQNGRKTIRLHMADYKNLHEVLRYVSGSSVGTKMH